MSRGFVAIVIAVIMAGPALSWGEPLTLTLAEAVERAGAAAPQIKRLEALVAASEARASGAAAARRPAVDLSAGYTRYSHVPEFSILLPTGQERTVFPDIPDAYQTRLGVALPLYTGGRLEKNLDAARQESSAAQEEAAAGRSDLELETTLAYWDLVTAVERERVLTEAIAAYESHLRDAENRERLGMAAPNDVLAVRVERDRAELARLQASATCSVAAANLIRLIGVEPGTDLIPAEPLEAPPRERPALPLALSKAQSDRPEIAAARSRVAAADAAAEAERGARFPQVSAGAGYDLANPNRRIAPLSDEWKGTWDVSVQAKWSVLDFGRTSSAVGRARALADAARKTLEEIEERIRLEVTSRWIELDSTTAAVAVADRAVQSARENRRVTADRYREGVSASSDLLDAETMLLRADLDRTVTLAALRGAWARLDRAVGR